MNHVAATFEIGSNLNTLLLPLVAAIILFFQNKQNKQYKNNGGSTMRDAIDRIEANQRRFEKAAIERLAKLEGHLVETKPDE